MCLYTKSSYSIVAKKDILCYKLLVLKDDKYISPYMGLEYKINAFNYPLDLCENIRFFRLYSDSYFFEVDKGFLHSYTFNGAKSSNIFYDIVCAPNTFYLFECYIPKGSKYFISHNKEQICSDKLFVKDKKVLLSTPEKLDMTFTSLDEEIKNTIKNFKLTK